MTSWLWLGLLILAVVIEAVTPQLVSIWFIAGFLGGMVASLLGAELWLQVVVVVVVSLITMIATRPLAKKFESKTESTNADRNIGTTGLVIEDIDPVKGTGRVDLCGVDWGVIKGDQFIPKGTEVVIDSIQGVKVKVHIRTDEDFK